MSVEESSKASRQSSLASEEIIDEPLVVSHLLADGQPEEFPSLADLHVQLGDTLHPFACHSSCLAKHSRLLSKLFAATERDGWAQGVATAFKDHNVSSWEVLLTMMHGSPQKTVAIYSKSSAFSTWEGMQDLLCLAHKLEAREILQVRNLGYFSMLLMEAKMVLGTRDSISLQRHAGM
jgi:hypothetical protein